MTFPKSSSLGIEPSVLLSVLLSGFKPTTNIEPSRLISFINFIKDFFSTKGWRTITTSPTTTEERGFIRTSSIGNNIGDIDEPDTLYLTLRLKSHKMSSATPTLGIELASSVPLYFSTLNSPKNIMYLLHCLHKLLSMLSAYFNFNC